MVEWLHPAWVWLGLGLICLAAEVVTGTYVLLLFGASLCLTALPAWFGAPGEVQLAVFAAASVTALTFVRPALLRWGAGDRPALRTNVDALPGQVGTVLRPIGGGAVGLVRLGGEEWSAIGVDDSAIDVGAAVEVVAVQGVKLVVRRRG